MPTFGPYSAWIELEGQRIPEWGVTQQVQPDGLTRISCWVPSSAGKDFRIGYSHTQGKTTSEVEFRIDGVAFPNEFLQPVHDPTRVSRGFKGVNTRNGLRAFRFEKCEMLEGPVAVIAGPIPGEIVVSFSDCFVTGMHTSIPTPDEGIAFLGRSARQPHHRFPHGLAHYAQISRTLMAPPQETIQMDSFKDEPRVQFVFHYRPLDVLLVEGRVYQCAS